MTTSTPPAPAAGRAEDPRDLSSLAFWQGTARDREATFAVLRAEAPVSWHRPPSTVLYVDPADAGFWAVVSHRHVAEATRRHEDLVSGEGIVFETLPAELLDAAQSIIAMDPPRHTAVRALVASAFTPRQVRRIADSIRTTARALVDEVAPHGEADVVVDLAAPLPMHTIFDTIGVPDADRRVLAHEARYAGGWNDPELMGDDEVLPRLFTAATTLHAYALDLAARRRDDPRDDVMTTLVQAEVDGSRLTDHEIAAFFSLLCIAGNDTTRQAAGFGTLALLEHPEQRDWWAADPAGRGRTAVEELVRWTSPIMTFRRTAARDVELGGAQIGAGDKVVLFYASANHDETVFDAPGVLDLSRDPNRHVGFGGGGIHHCLGVSLARQSLAALFGELLTRLPDLELAGEPQRGVSTFFHTLSHLPVRFSPSPVA